MHSPRAHQRFHARRRGTAAVELAVVLSLLVVPVLIGLWEVGRLVHVEQILSNAARETARRGASGQKNDAESAAVAIAYLRSAGLPTANATVTIDNITAGQSVTYNAGGSAIGGGGVDLQNAAQMDQLRVTVRIPFTDVRWIALDRITSGDILDGEAFWFCLKDRDFPTLGDPPIE